MTAWDGGLDVATGPKFGTLEKDAESNFMTGEARKRARASDQEDMAMTEISGLSYDYQKTVRNNDVPATHTPKDLFEYISGSFCVSNRTAINKIFYSHQKRARDGADTRTADITTKQPIGDSLLHLRIDLHAGD